MPEKFIATVPLARPSTRLDIANAALRPACDEADFRIGAGPDVDSGGCIR